MDDYTQKMLFYNVDKWNKLEQNIYGYRTNEKLKCLFLDVIYAIEKNMSKKN